MTDDCTWGDVERLISDLKSDGYEPADLETSTSHAAPTKTVFLDVERAVDTATEQEGSQ